MDFLEIRRKAKERAEARARTDAPARPWGPGAASATPAPTLDRDAADPAAVAPDHGRPSEVPDPQPDFSRLEPFEAVLQAVEAAGGELTPIPDLPPWNDALSTPAATARDRETSATPAGKRAFDAIAAPVETPAFDPLDEFFYRPGESAPGFPDLDLGARPPPVPAQVADPLREYLTFLLGDEEYAIDIERVREVLKAPAITDVPRAPDHVLGVIMVRGDVIAVFDPRRRLGLPEVDRTSSPRVLVCDDGLGSIGLLVDAVSQVVRLRRSEIEPRPQGIGAVSAEYISGIGRQADRMFIVLDLPVVLRGKVAAAAEAAS